MPINSTFELMNPKVKKKFFVYIVRTSTSKLYTGISTDPIRRLKEHNHGKLGAKCLRGQLPTTLVWISNDRMTRAAALMLERSIKALDKQGKELLVSLAKPQ